MALRNLRSDLAAGDFATPEAANLTFGKGTAYDRPGQRFSNEPFIREGLNFSLSDSGFNSVTDAFIRGGAVFSTERRLEDQRRIGRFLITSKGLSFIAKQIGLQKSNPKISEPSLPSFSNSPADHRSYNSGLNTLAQVVGQGTGLHVNRQGRSPIANEGYVDEERFRDSDKNNATGQYSNRLLYLYDNHILSDPPKEKEPTSKIGQFFSNIKKKVFPKAGEPLYSYNGGPGSTYGIGKTDIRKFESTGGIPDTSNFITKFSFDDSAKGFGTIPIFNVTKDSLNIGILRDLGLVSADYFTVENSDKDLEDLAKRDKNFEDVDIRLGKEGNLGNTITSIRQENRDNGYKVVTPSRIGNYLSFLRRPLTETTKILGATDYDQIVKGTNSVTFRREERVNLGSPGGNPDPELGTSTVDLLNAMDVFKSLGGSDSGRQEIRDLVRFRIEAVDTDSPLNTDVMVFRAFLDSLNDNFSANYNEFNYNGRGESFFTYNSFNRGVDFSFKIAAQSSREMKPIYRKLNYLLSNTAPDYSNTSGRMRTPFVRVTIGAYLDRLPGVITGVSINWNKDYVWEIALDSPEDINEESLVSKGQFVLPHVLDVNVTFQPIHDFLPRKSVKSPFIIPSEKSGLSAGKTERKSWNNTDVANNLNGAALKITTTNA
jgi:hypothetical protein